jgi:hypothetical protein
MTPADKRIATFVIAIKVILAAFWLSLALFGFGPQ